MRLLLHDVELLRDRFCDIAERYFMVQYLYGGRNPLEGVDCSQLVVNCLRSIGWLESWEDLSAHGLWDKFSQRYPSAIANPMRGCLAFWFKNNRAVHVGICLDHLMTIQAAGGDSATDTPDEATEKGAYVKYKRVDKDSRPVRFVNIFDPASIL